MNFRILESRARELKPVTEVTTGITTIFELKELRKGVEAPRLSVEATEREESRGKSQKQCGKLWANYRFRMMRLSASLEMLPAIEWRQNRVIMLEGMIAVSRNPNNE